MRSNLLAGETLFSPALPFSAPATPGDLPSLSPLPADGPEDQDTGDLEPGVDEDALDADEIDTDRITTLD